MSIVQRQTYSAIPGGRSRHQGLTLLSAEPPKRLQEHRNIADRPRDESCLPISVC